MCAKQKVKPLSTQAGNVAFYYATAMVKGRKNVDSVHTSKRIQKHVKDFSQLPDEDKQRWEIEHRAKKAERVVAKLSFAVGASPDDYDARSPFEAGSRSWPISRTNFDYDFQTLKEEAQKVCQSSKGENVGSSNRGSLRLVAEHVESVDFDGDVDFDEVSRCDSLRELCGYLGDHLDEVETRSCWCQHLGFCNGQHGALEQRVRASAKHLVELSLSKPRDSESSLMALIKTEVVTPEGEVSVSGLVVGQGIPSRSPHFSDYVLYYIDGAARRPQQREGLPLFDVGSLEPPFDVSLFDFGGGHSCCNMIPCCSDFEIAVRLVDASNSLVSIHELEYESCYESAVRLRVTKAQGPDCTQQHSNHS